MFQAEASSSTPAQIAVPDLTPDYDLKMTVVNERVVIRDDAVAAWRVVLVSGVVFARYSHDDAVSERYVCVQLRLSGLATQVEIVDAFGYVRATQCRWERLYRDEGLSGLFTEPPQGRRSTMPMSVEDAVVDLHAEGLGMRRIAARLGLTLHEVSGVYKRRSLTPHLSQRQEKLFADPAPGGCAEVTEDEWPGDGPENNDTDEAGAEPWDGVLAPQYESGSGVSRGLLGGLRHPGRARVLRAPDDGHGDDLPGAVAGQAARAPEGPGAVGPGAGAGAAARTGGKDRAAQARPAGGPRPGAQGDARAR